MRNLRLDPQADKIDKIDKRSIAKLRDVSPNTLYAVSSVRSTQNCDDANVSAINRGGDADNVGAVTGMIAGRIYVKTYVNSEG